MRQKDKGAEKSDSSLGFLLSNLTWGFLDLVSSSLMRVSYSTKPLLAMFRARRPGTHTPHTLSPEGYHQTGVSYYRTPAMPEAQVACCAGVRTI